MVLWLLRDDQAFVHGKNDASLVYLGVVCVKAHSYFIFSILS